MYQMFSVSVSNMLVILQPVNIAIELNLREEKNI